jgi:hypothetical protein
MKLGRINRAGEAMPFAKFARRCREIRVSEYPDASMHIENRATIGGIFLSPHRGAVTSPVASL